MDLGDDDDEPVVLSEFDEEPPAAPPPQRKPLRPGPERIPDTPPLPSGVRKATTEDLDPAGFPDAYDRDLDLSLRDPRYNVNLQPELEDDDYDPEAEDEEAAEFTFTRGGAETVEELDLAAMVDVAFQLVLFFLVTASTVVFKTLEIPKPKAEDKKGASSQSVGARSIESLEEDYILVEIDPNGVVTIDHEKAPNDFNGIANRLRDIREKTQRRSMLLSADLTTPHKSAVLAYDAANEIGLGIAIAAPKNAGDKPPAAAKAP